MVDNDDICGFPAFLRPEHPLAKYSDATFHIACLNACPDRPALETLYQRFREIFEGRPRNLTSIKEMEAWGREAYKDFG
jgi:hypothetical protein